MRSIIFMMPRWKTPSEHFLQRQIRMLEEENQLAAIIVWEVVDEEFSSRNTPILSINGHIVQREIRKRAARFVGRKLGQKWYSPRTQQESLKFLLETVGGNKILCQFGSLAVNFQKALRETSHDLFIHVHGVDTEEQMNADGYPEDLRELSRHAQVISNSRETYERMLKWGIDPSRMVIKYNGVEIPEKPRQRESQSKVTILHLGRLVDCKSPDRTLEAFEMACNWGLDGELIMAGDGPLRPMCELIRTRSPWRDRISILGSVSPEVGQQLRKEADIFTMHSIRGEITGQVEALGVSIIEAMADALPVVGCRIGGVRETVVDNLTGILVKPGDVEAQANAFLKLARDPQLRTQMGVAGWERAKENFDYRIEKTALLNILEIAS